MNFGKRLVLLRYERNLTRKEFCDATAIKYSTVAHYENNRRFPSKENLYIIQDYFGCYFDYLYGKSDIKYISKVPQADDINNIDINGLTSCDIHLVKLVINRLYKKKLLLIP